MNIKSNLSSKKIIVFFLDNSAGEVYVGLPILWYIKKQMNVDIYFVSNNKNILNKLKISKPYLKIMNEIGILQFGTTKILFLLTKLFLKNELILIMSCFSGMRIVDKFFYSILRKSTMVYYPHAYTLLSIDKNHNFTNYLNERKEKFFDKFGRYSHLLSNTCLEDIYFKEKGWDLDRVHYVGALGYKEEWQKNILKTFQKKLEINHLNIFIPLRDKHPIFLFEENYEYLLNSFLELFNQFPQHNFIVKFHPRQQNIEQYKNKLIELSNVEISDKSPLEILQVSDLTISVWSSILQDSASMGVPAIEFYRHSQKFPQIVKDEKGRSISLFYKYGFCRFIDNIEELTLYLKSMTKEKLHDMAKKQYDNLDKVFNISNIHTVTNLQEIVNKIYVETQEKNLEKEKEKEKYLQEIIKNIFRVFYRKIINVK